MASSDGRKTVAAAGTAERLSTASVGVRSVVIVPLPDNTGLVVVGASTVDATATSERGIPLSVDGTDGVQSITLSAGDGFDDLREIWVDAANNDDGVAFFASGM